MNKNELAIEVSKRVRIPLKEVISVIDCTLDVIGVTLINDELCHQQVGNVLSETL